MMPVDAYCGTVGLVKRREELRLLLRRDADAGVFYRTTRVKDNAAQG